MKKVLIIEDDRVLREAVHFKLAHEGYEVIEASNGELGYQAILDESPDVVLLDVEMPKLGGIGVLEKLKKNLIEAKVIVLTNVEESETLADAMELGVTTYLIKKDWTLDRVVEEIENITNWATHLKL